jgi:bacterioferritin-associated ferredoxin
MIVCVCKSVSDKKIRASIADGADTFDELQFELGVGMCCGKCVDTVHDVMAQSGCTSHCHAGGDQRQAVPLTFYERKAA